MTEFEIGLAGTGALLLMVFAFAFAASEAVGFVERRIEYYAGAR